MKAPLHTLKLSLTADQSQQWVSYAREISQQSSLGYQLALHCLKAPSRWFTLDRGYVTAPPRGWRISNRR